MCRRGRGGGRSLQRGEEKVAWAARMGGDERFLLRAWLQTDLRFLPQGDENAWRARDGSGDREPRRRFRRIFGFAAGKPAPRSEKRHGRAGRVRRTASRCLRNPRSSQRKEISLRGRPWRRQARAIDRTRVAYRHAARGDVWQAREKTGAGPPR